MPLSLDPAQSLPKDGCAGTLIGRVWRPRERPAVVTVAAECGLVTIASPMLGALAVTRVRAGQSLL